MSKKKIRARCEIDTEEESNTHDGDFKIYKKVLEVPITERIRTDEEEITTYEICVEKQNHFEGSRSSGFSVCRFFIDEKDLPEDLLKVLEKYSVERDSLV